MHEETATPKNGRWESPLEKDTCSNYGRGVGHPSPILRR